MIIYSKTGKPLFEIPDIGILEFDEERLYDNLIGMLDDIDLFNFGCTCKKFSKLAKKRLGFRPRPLKGNHCLKNHQIKALLWMLECEKQKIEGIDGGLLSLQQGLGKTLCTLYLCYLSLKKSPFLIIVKKSVIGEWETQIKRFFGDRMSYIVFHKENLGSDFDNMSPVELERYDIVLTTYNVIAGAATQGLAERALIRDSNGRVVGIQHVKTPYQTAHPRGVATLYTRRWNRVGTDESQQFVNRKTRMFEGLMGLHAKHRWCLTGTAIRNRHTDMFNLLVFLGYDGCSTEKNWGLNYDVYFKDISKRVMYMTYDDAKIQLPKLNDIDSSVELSEFEMRKYGEFQAAAKVLVNDTDAKYMNVLSQLTKMRQSTIATFLLTRESKKNPSGIYYDNDEIVKDINGISGFRSTKMRKVLQIIRSREDEKFLVFSTFSSALVLLEKLLTKKGISSKTIDGSVTGIQRITILKEFTKDDDIRALLMTFKTGSEGLNLTCATNVIILDPWWCPVEEKQAIARAWRMYQTSEVNVYRIIAKETVDERIMNICRSKEKIDDYYRYGIEQPANQKLTMDELRKLIG